MSHFTVAVFTDKNSTVANLLAPYDENNNEYFKFTPTSFTKNEIMEYYKLEKDNNESLNEFVKRYFGYEYDNKTENFGFYSNPNAKWDWYDVEGRYENLIRLKSNPNTECNSAYIKDIDFSIKENEYRQALRYWEVTVENAHLNPNENPDDFIAYFKPEYMIWQYGNKETYAKWSAYFPIHAFITPDGKWHEKGKMQWFGVCDTDANMRETFINEFEETIKNNQDCVLTLVDCHI